MLGVFPLYPHAKVHVLKLIFGTFWISGAFASLSHFSPPMSVHPCYLFIYCYLNQSYKHNNLYLRSKKQNAGFQRTKVQVLPDRFQMV